ncbi:hypothetical protein [Oleisolibacter albus]|uniref:hypothetical protein n=1 Tax=Oleisolibacter albus TaxID=2171757 RepID=UPI000DF3B2F6|nr:hypothetical protein [Oleisolibacter albus]
MRQATSSFHAFALKFLVAATALGLATIAALSTGTSRFDDSARQEWVRNIPVAGTNFSFQ